jgi:hypothetical protein
MAVMPAQAGIHDFSLLWNYYLRGFSWMPACAGMTCEVDYYVLS